MKKIEDYNVYPPAIFDRCRGMTNVREGCGSLLLIEEKDIFMSVFKSDVLPEVATYFSYFCPQCHTLNHINDSFIPFIMKKKIRKKFKHNMFDEYSYINQIKQKK